MALIRMIKDFQTLNNEKLLKRAEELTPELIYRNVVPAEAFRLIGETISEREMIAWDEVAGFSFGKGECICLDFGDHQVGHVALEFSAVGSHPDAPALLKFQFAETQLELSEKTEAYCGWLSQSWIQEEYIHLDILPTRITLPRRYAFRYLKIVVIDTSPKYRLVINDAVCKAETSADCSNLQAVSFGDKQLDLIYRVSLRTLENCMQLEYEDGPKRDRRLWVGDLRLQALVNTISFRNYQLTKRCLYLCAGSRFEDGRISACLFTKPEVQADDTYLFDYALLYVVALEEYLQETSDEEALTDLYEIAMKQIERSLAMCDEHGVLSLAAIKDTFIDWAEELDKAACAQAVLLYGIKYAISIARRKKDWQQIRYLSEERLKIRKAAIDSFWDPKQRCFVSNGQISLASQVWMVLADVLPLDQAGELMERADSYVRNCPIRTPYMYHYYISALLHVGQKEKALAQIRYYWGSMLDMGADTFWEAWNPEEPSVSPYGNIRINDSFCHAWSCTPAYLLDRYYK